MDDVLLPRLPFQYAKRYGVVVTVADPELLTLAHYAPLSTQVFLELRRHFQKPIASQLVDREEFSVLLASAYDGASSSALDVASEMALGDELQTVMASLGEHRDLLESEDDAPIIKMINALMREALQQGASDMHFEVFEEALVVRFRIDGILREVLRPPRAIAPLLISRLKIMGKLDIAEKRLPQDGRIALRLAGRAVDVRLSTMPTHFGERIVLRVLDKHHLPLNLSSLGMCAEALEQLQALVHHAHGIILVTGPTGSGKTTTLYAGIMELDHAQKNILTVEDPIEYDLPGIGQTAVNPKIDMTFSRGLRAILRQDPDVVMVGEIRDLETVKMAMQASLTGHLVFSTLHTNSAVGAIARLRDMGAESFLLSSTVIGVVAQRLVRLLCEDCRCARTTRDSDHELLGLVDSKTVYDAVGCEVCCYTGYRGRTGIYEVIRIDANLKKLIHDEAGEQVLAKAAHQQAATLRQDGWRQVLLGRTTIEEVLRVTDESQFL